MPPIILAVTPSHRCDPSLAIAANRAGAVGLLDLGLTQPVEALRQAIERLDRHSSQPARWGVRWDTLGAETRMPNMLSALRKEPFPYLLLAGLRGKGSSAQIRTALEQARTLARVVLLEVYDAEAARAAATSSIDGVVIKAGEAGGRVSSSSAFMLLQTLRGRMDKPYWIQGAWGPDNATSAVLAGAAGVVLGEELWLARESPFHEDERQRLAGLDGSETVCIGTPQVQFRLFKQGSPDALNEIEQRAGEGSDWPDLLHEHWLAEGLDPLPLGQGIAFAAGLARRHITTGGILNEFNRIIEHNLMHLRQQPGLTPGNALAQECGVHHPIFQGPMTRVSDVVPFCAAVAENGALPFLALALLRGPEVRKLLEETSERLGERSWGVGILGFVPPELRKEQLDVVLELKPRFAIIAGGRPAQAKELEEAGIATYLHVPSPGLLESFLREGARKFIFEGRECGGHVGPRTSLTLWQSALDVLRETPIKDPENLHVIFAGGIHDDFSAALVSALAPALVERGAKIGVLMGTAYLFTEEAVASGAITPMFQEQAASCEGTTLLESGVGHATRCARTPFADEFEQLKKKLIREGRSGDEVRLELEMLNVGRLRLASKGLRRQARPGNGENGEPITASSGPQATAGTDAPSPAAAVNDDQASERRQQLARGARLLANGPLEEVSEETQRREGLYMIGEVAALRDQPLPMARLHEQVAAEGAETAASLARKALEGGAEAEQVSPTERAAVSRAGSPADSREGRPPVSRTERAPVSRTSGTGAPRSDRSTAMRVEDAGQDEGRTGEEPVAIIGMACQFPDAPDLRTYWRNIVNRVDAVRDVPPDRWDTDIYYSPDRLERDKIYSKTGGFLGESSFDPIRYGIPPASLASIEPIQLITLDTARLALEDAGYGTRPFPRERTAVIFGAGGVNERGMAYAMRTMLPQYLHQVEGLDEETRSHIITNLNGKFPEWTEDSFPGFLFNVISGRVANRLDLQGPNFVVDAACAASLAALHTAVQQLRAGLTDMALVGGSDGTNNALGFMSFAKTHALTPGDKVRPFDAAADGIVLGEGVAAVVLKRLGDAERDGDRIYAVIRGVGSSSDGRNRSLTAPHAAAQAVALRRAYADAGFQPDTVSLIEAHATGTAVGDRSEIEALKEVFDGAEQAEAACAIGSVKSMIGHTKSVAGIAGLIKTALALKHRILPPTINVEEPNKAVENSPFFISTETRPWIHHGGDHPRRAGVSAFGFGGTNFHVALEEHTGDYHDSTELDLTPRPAELFLFRRPDAATFVKDLSALAGKLDGIPEASLRQLAYSLHLDEQHRQRMSGVSGAAAGEVRLGLLASSMEELRTRLERACELAGKGGTHAEPGGFHLTDAPPADPGQVCFLFPGQGSQRINMLKDLVQFGPFGPDTHEAADRLLWDLVPRRLSSVIYPAPVFSPDEEKAQQAALNDTRFAQPALGVTNLFAADVLNRFGLTPAFAAGHSYGEYVALCAGGGCTRNDLLRLSALRGQAVHQAGLDNPGAMAAVTADEEKTRAVLDEINLPLHLANLNAPNQTIIAGPKEAIESALKEFRKHRLAIRRIPVSAAFHTPAMEEPLKAFAAHLEEIDLTATKIPVFSNVSAEPYTADVKDIRHQLAIHLARPVRFVEQIQALHRAGARIFIETGPGRILTGLVKRILADQDHETVALDMPGQPGWLPLGQLLVKAAVLGLPVEPAPWFQSRGLETMGVEECLQQARKQAEGRPSDYLLSPGRSRPVREPVLPSAQVTAAVGTVQPARSPDAAMSTPAGRVAASATSGSAVGLPPASTANPLASAGSAGTGLTGASAGGQQPSLDTPAATAAAAVAKGTASVTHDPLLSQLQENMSKWLELHRENQRMSERFLQLQERIVDGLLAGRGASLPPGRSVSPTGLSVAPAPVLPNLQPTGGGPVPSPPTAPEAGAVQGSHPGAGLDVMPVAPAPVGEAAPQGADSGAVDPTEQETATVDPASPSNGVPSVEEFQRDLVAEVSRRTGYPEDTLDMDMALEAGLGIDSIKIMEIFSALKQYHQYLADEDQDEEEVLVQFTEMKTLGKIVEHYTGRREKILSGDAVPAGQRATSFLEKDPEGAGGDEPGPSAMKEAEGTADGSDSERTTGTPEPAEAGHVATAAVEADEDLTPAVSRASAKVERLVLRSRLAPPADEEAGAGALDAFPRDQLLLVLGDAPELASSVEAALSASGFHVVQVVPGPAFKRVNAQRYEACLTDPASVETLARSLKEESEHRVGALINLLTLAEGNSKPGLNGYDAPLELIQSLANVARVFETDLRESAAAGGGRLINVTTLDGRFGLRGEHALPVTQAGSLGFFKSLAREWRGVKVKTIDLDPNADARHLVVGLLRELATWDDQVEVGLDGDGRWRLELVNESISDDTAPSDEAVPLLGREAVILVTGGAHGITSAFARRMARQTRARLVIVGRSRLTAREEEPADLRDLSGEAELRAALIEDVRTRGREVVPAEVEQDLKQILKSRAIRDNLEAMRTAGAEVEYHSLDVRDERRFGALMDDLYDRFGRIDGVIHGAGVVEDGWLRNKNAASVSRVFDTKVRSALALARKLRPESLRFLVFFSSLSGRLGNAGQVDYSAANEFLNKLAAHLDHEWPARVVAINWGPWDTGMMSEGLRSAYRERGIELIPVEAGIDSLMEELGRAVPGEPEVVLTCSPRELASFA